MIQLGRYIVSYPNSHKRKKHFQVLLDFYATALYSGSNLSAKQRENAVLKFQEAISYFDDGDQDIIALIREKLNSPHLPEKTLAIRILAELKNRDYLKKLSDILTSPSMFQLSSKSLVKLFVFQSPPRQFIERAIDQKWPIRLSIIEAVFHESNDYAYQLFNQLITNESVDTLLFKHLAKTIAKWEDKHLIKRLQHELKTPALPTHWWDIDIHAEIAFYLSLNGELDNIGFLENLANGENVLRSAIASQHLAWLAWPGAIKPIHQLLRINDESIVYLALGAVSTIKSASLMLPLLYLLVERGEPENIDSTMSIFQQVISVLQAIGGPLPHGFHRKDKNYIKDIIAFYKDVLENLDLKRRYYNGQMLNLKHLVSDLSSIHTGYVQSAAYNLQSIIGESYGFDVDDDLIANLPAIHTWRQKVEKLTIFEPGGWGLAGQPLEYSFDEEL